MKVELSSVNRAMVLKTVDRCLGTVIRATGKLFGGRMARAKTAAGATLLSLLVSFPPYEGYYKEIKQAPDLTIQALLIKIHNPLSPIPAELKDIQRYDGQASHIEKLELRLTLPVLGWISGTGKWTVLVWSHLAGLGAFYLLATLAGQALDDDVGGALFALALAPAFFGTWFFHDIDYGDGVAYFLLLLTMASRNSVVAALSFIAAAFADERCVTAAPLLLLFFAVNLSTDQEKVRLRGRCTAILVGAATWVALRIWLEHSYHLTMGTSFVATREAIGQNLSFNMPGVFLSIFEAAWILPVFAGLSLWTQRRWAALFALAGAFAVAVAPAFLVYDFDRSVCYTFPILLTSLYFLRGEIVFARKALAAMLLVNLLLISPGMSVLRFAIP